MTFPSASATTSAARAAGKAVLMSATKSARVALVVVWAAGTVTGCVVAPIITLNAASLEIWNRLTGADRTEAIPKAVLMSVARWAIVVFVSVVVFLTVKPAFVGTPPTVTS